MNKRATNKQFAEGVSLLNKYDIDYLAAFVLGFPGETDETIQENIDFIRDNGVRYYSLKEFYYMPHTLVHEKREEYRTEEHTSELQSLMSRSSAVSCLKKK